MPRPIAPFTHAGFAFASLLLSGCAVSTVTVSSPTAGLSCVDDSLDCIGKRQAALRHLTGDRTRAWVRQAPTAEAYASGVRLFAFRKTKAELTCDELKIGRREADNAAQVLRGPSAKNLSPAQVSRGAMLASEVARDLTREMRRRCKGKA